MFVLEVFVGFCLGAWCTIDRTPNYPSWEACNQERAAIIETMIKPDYYEEDEDSVIVIKCRPQQENYGVEK